MEKDILEKYVDDYDIFLDTGAVLNENFLEFWRQIEPILEEKKHKAIMLDCWAKELLKKIKNHQAEHKSLGAILLLCRSRQFVVKNKMFSEKKTLDWYSRDNQMIVIVDPVAEYGNNTIEEIKQLNMRKYCPSILLLKIGESGNLEEISESSSISDWSNLN